MTTDRFCRSCGAPIAPDAQFCESCGHAMGAAPAPPGPPAAAPAAPSLLRGRLPVVVAGVVVMVAVVAGVIWWTGRDPGGDSTAQTRGGPAVTVAASATAGGRTGAVTAAPAVVTSPSPSATATILPTRTATPRTPSPTPARTSTTPAGDIRPLLGDWDIRSATVTEDGETTDSTEEMADSFLRLLTHNNGATIVIEIWMPYTESFELTEVTLRQTGTGRYEGTGEGDDDTDLNVTARLSDGNNRLELTFVDADPLADPPNRLVLVLARRSAGGVPTPTPTAAAIDLRRPETYLPAAGRHFTYVETYVDGSGSSEPEAVAARIPGGPAITRLELTPDDYAGMLTIAMHFVVRADGVYLAYDPYPDDLRIWLARDLAVGRRWSIPGTANGPGGVQFLVLEIGGACPLKKVSLSNCMTVRADYSDTGYTFIQWYAPGYGEVLRKDAANLQTVMELVAVEEIGESTALAIVRPEAPNVAKVPR